MREPAFWHRPRSLKSHLLRPLAALYGAGAAIYRRDCSSTLRVVYVRLQDNAADLFNEPDPLGPFRDYWNLNGAGVSRDLFTFLTGRRNLSYGGVAWLNAACTDYGYAVTAYINGRFADPIASRMRCSAPWPPPVAPSSSAGSR